MKKWYLVFSLLISVIAAQAKEGDTTIVQCFQFSDPSPKGWQAKYTGEFIFPDDERTWSKIIMVKTLKCDEATAGDKYPCGEWDYITNTNVLVPVGDTVELFEIAAFVTPYGKGLNLTDNGWEWTKEVTDYAPLLKGKRLIQSGNNLELQDLKFIFIEGTPAREALKVQNVWPWGNYKYEYLANDSLLSARSILLDSSATSFKVMARISGHGHSGPYNCCEWDAKHHSYLFSGWKRQSWTVWKNCGDNPIFPQGGTWQFDRAGWCPGTFVDEYAFPLDKYVWAGDSLEIDYEIEMYRDNGEKKGRYRMSHQLFTYGKYNYTNDVEVLEVLNPNGKDRYCRFNPSCGDIRVVIRNNGIKPLQSCEMTYQLNNEKQESYSWLGHLEFGEADTIFLRDYRLTQAKTGSSFKVKVGKPNQQEDGNLFNNQLETKVKSIDVLPNKVVLMLKTNDLDRAKETQWMLLDQYGKIVQESGLLSDDSTYNYELQLAKGCYKLVFTDQFEDGMIHHWWKRSTPEQVGKYGKIRLLDVEGEVIKKLPFDFAEYLIYTFRVE